MLHVIWIIRSGDSDMFQNQQRPSFALSTQYTQGNCKELTDDISHNHQWPVLFPAESIEHVIETYCNSTTIMGSLVHRETGLAIPKLDAAVQQYFEGGLATSTHKIPIPQWFEQVCVFLCPVRWFEFTSCFSSNVMLLCCTLPVVV